MNTPFALFSSCDFSFVPDFCFHNSVLLIFPPTPHFWTMCVPLCPAKPQTLTEVMFSMYGLQVRVLVGMWDLTCKLHDSWFLAIICHILTSNK